MILQNLETGVVYNVYKNGTRIDDPKLRHSKSQQYQCSYAAPITGAGQTGFVLRDDSGETLASTVIQLDEEQITPTAMCLLYVKISTVRLFRSQEHMTQLSTGGDSISQQQQVLIPKILI